VVRSHRTGEEETLPLVAADRPQFTELGLGLDTFGDHRHPEGVGHGGYRPDDLVLAAGSLDINIWRAQEAARQRRQGASVGTT